ncbi:MAG: ATP-binding protein [Acidimicrobiales bacterium]
MDRFSLRSVRVRITAVATLVVAAAIALAGFVLVQAIESKLLDKVRTQGQAQLDATEAQLVSGGVPIDELKPFIIGTTGNVLILDNQGRPVSGVVGSAGVGGGEPSPFTAYLENGMLVDGTTEISVPFAGHSTAIPFDVQSTTVQTAAGQAYRIVVASPLDGVEESINALKGSLLTALPFVVALVALVAWLVVGRALQPVEAMRREVESITGTTMHRRVPEPRTSDEISRLAHTMNAMLDRLETSAAQQRQFVSDASHELRSPIAAIRAELEVALRAGERADWPQVAEGLLEEEDRLEVLVADLLLLASVDEQSISPDDASIDISGLVAAESARSRRVAVTVLPSDPVYVSGQADQLARVIGNLLDNATRFARRTVEVTLSTDGRTVRVSVDDDGPGIAVQDRQRVFERFTRLDQSRARDVGGAGLGLALAKSIVERHHGTIHVDDSPIGGARVVVVLPAVGAQALTKR